VHESRGSSGVQLVVASLAFCLVGGAIGLAILTFRAGFVLGVFAGHAYTSAGVYLPWYAMAMTMLGGASVLVANGQARGRGDFLAILIPVTVAEPLLIARFHQSLGQVVQMVSISMAVLFIGLSILYLVQARARTRPVLVLEGSAA
jgi:hypothetical protein